MLIHEFVSGNKPVMVLIHGVLTPWQVWMPQIEFYKNRYNVYAVSLNAHTEEKRSEFISVCAEAEDIIRRLKERGIQVIDVLCGISLGGKIAHEIWKNGKIEVLNLVLDGAPLVKCPKFAVRIMISNYKSIIHRSKRREAKVIENYKRYFLPEKYLESYLKIADRMSDASIENMVNSVFAGGELRTSANKSRILFIHGTKANEVLSKKSARLMKKYYPETRIVCFKGSAHCYTMIYQPEQWIECVEMFLQE